MLATVSDSEITSLKQATMGIFSRVAFPVCPTNQTCYPGEDLFHYPAQTKNAALVFRDDLPNARPVYEGPWDGINTKRVMSKISYSSGIQTKQSLIGSMTYSPEYQTIVYYHPDSVLINDERIYKIWGRAVSYDLMEFGSALQVLDLGPDTAPVVKINYHADREEYIILYNCFAEGGSPVDICLKRSTSPWLTGVTLGLTDSNQYGLQLYNDPGVPKDGNHMYSLGQFDVRVNYNGHHFSDQLGDVVVFFPVAAGTDPTPYGKDIYAKQVFLDP